jgi:hypothetical protein
MFSPLRGFNFKPTEEEQQIRAKLEEQRRRESGIDFSTSAKHSKRESVSVSVSSNYADKDVVEPQKRESKTTQVQPTENRGTKSKIESSAYYFSKSTDPEKAKQFKPVKIDEQTTSEKSQKTVGSLWNTGSTMEEYDYTEWIHQRLKEELLKVTFEGAPIKIDDVENVGGAATYLFARGKLRAGWDLNFKAKWKGTVDNEEAEGTISMEDICDCDDAYDWGFHVDVQKAKSEAKAREIIKKEKKKILDAIDIVISDFRSKKKTIK